MSERAQRHQRKLPSMPLSRTQDFWPTFRGAVDWMLKHQDTIETALNLLEIYPKLIQHKSCDRLWNFLSKVAFFHKQEVSLQNDKIENNTEHKSRSGKGKDDLPKIAVTETKDNKTDKARLVYLCGNFEDEKWKTVVQGLSEKFFIRCCEKKLTTPEDSLNIVLMSDSFIFIIDDKTLTDSYYLNLLLTALVWRIPVTFIREPSFVLPDPLPQTVFNMSDKQTVNERPSTTPDLENRTKPYRENMRSLSANHLNTECEKHSVIELERLKSSRPLSAFSESCVGSTVSLALPVITPLPTPGPSLKKSRSDSQALSKLAALSKLNNARSNIAEKVLPPPPSVPFSDMLRQGYDKAVLYHRLYHNDCLERIAAVLKDETELVEPTWKKLPNLIQTSQAEDLYKSDDSANEACIDFDPITDMTKETKQTINNEKRVSLDSCKSSEHSLCSPVETVYAVFSENKASPELVHWPVREQTEISASPSIESFGFQDVDLSLNVNIDFSSSDEA